MEVVRSLSTTAAGHRKPDEVPMATKDSAVLPPKGPAVPRPPRKPLPGFALPSTTGTVNLRDLNGWRTVVAAVRAKDPSFAPLLEEVALLRFGPERVVLGFRANTFLDGLITGTEWNELLLSALSSHFGQTPDVVLEPIRAESGHLTLAMVANQVDPLRKSLQRARRVAPELRAAVDATNLAIERVEEALAALNLGVTASVNLDPKPPSDGDWLQYVRFGKDGSTWRLMLESGVCGDGKEDWSQSPLLSASKEVRLQAVERLPDLINALVDAAEDQVRRFRAAAEKAQALAAAIAETK